MQRALRPIVGIAVVAAITAVVLGRPAAAAPETARPPNVLFILADDLGWADTTLYGGTSFYETPNLDRLAKRGMLFTRAYSASPLCSPTRAAIITGQSPARTGITAPSCHLPTVETRPRPGTKAPPGEPCIMPISATRLDTAHRTLAEAFRGAGYATGHFGKWHLGAPPHSPIEHGFDVDVPHWLPPAVSVHAGDWKLIHVFHGLDPHRHLLFDLAADPGETRNLAAGKPDLVAALDAKIAAFLAATGAVVPMPNPAFDPARHRAELIGKPRRSPGK